MDFCLVVSIIIEFHASPVEHLRRVRKALVKDWKFAWTSRLSWSFTPAKMNTPRTEKIYRKSKSRPPMLVSAGITTITVSKMILICFAYFIYLKTLDILIALIKVVEAPKSASIQSEIEVDIIEVTTMQKSKELPESLKYARQPNANNFKIDSIVNMMAKE